MINPFMRHFSLFFLAFVIVFSSCVPTRKLIYLQKKKGDETRVHTHDAVLREYKIEDFDYKIQTNDIIWVKYQSLTEQEFDLSQQQTTTAGGTTGGALMRGELVDEHGEIPVQVVGKVKVAGLTVFQAQDTLQKLANRFLESTIVKVRLLNYRVTILGEVNQEGTIPLQENRVSLLEAIGLAGGLGELADRSNIKIIRQVNSKTEVSYVNVLSEDFMKSPFYYVHQNDLIIVPPLKQRTFKKYFTQNVALLLSGVSVVLLVLSLTRR
jgi:polysaccharide export outer membrane protein